MSKLGTIVGTVIATFGGLYLAGALMQNSENEGYEKGYEAGKNVTRDEILKDLVDSKENQE